MVSRNSFQRALTAHQTGNHKKAGAICDNILKRQPGDFDALHLRGLVAFETNNRQEAIRFIEKSLEINPSQPSALNNIGNIHRKIGNLEKARDVYRRALRLQPEFPDAWSNLSIIYHDMDKMDEALDMVQSALKIDPDHAIANHTLGFLLMENNDLEGAAKAFERCTKSKPPKNLTPIWYAKILINFDMLVEAERMLIRWLKQYPGDEVALHYIDAIRGNESSRTSELAVRGTFDNFAASFDKVLLGNLDYRAPQLVGEAVHQTYNNEKCLRIADLGCGTGLMAPMLAPLAEMLVGIDLSDKMLQKARSRGGYHELVNDDLVKYLNGMGEGSFSTRFVISVSYRKHLMRFSGFWSRAGISLQPLNRQNPVMRPTALILPGALGIKSAMLKRRSGRPGWNC